jgi:hypothetical protein
MRHENLTRYRNLLVKTADETQRSQLFKLIAEEELQLILQELDWSSPTEIVTSAVVCEARWFLQTADAGCIADVRTSDARLFSTLMPAFELEPLLAKQL